MRLVSLRTGKELCDRLVVAEGIWRFIMPARIPRPDSHRDADEGQPISKNTVGGADSAHNAPAQIPRPDCYRDGVGFIGLLGRRTLDPREGLLIPQCHAIHTFFMRFPIAVLFLDDDMRILRMEIRHPWRLPTRCARASAVLELHPSIFTSHQLRLGEKLKVW